MTNVPDGPAGPQPEWSPPKTADGKIDWKAIPQTRDPSLGFHKDHHEKRASEERTAKMVEDMARMEEAKTERERLKRGQATPLLSGSRQLVGRSLGGIEARA